ncbi:MAG: lamin tail domain-containing protein [Fibrobacter sp.]|nr:lamin tail domain-containing protein [Fibrobacter sp.]
MRDTHLKQILPIVTMSALSAFGFWGCSQGENPEGSVGELSSVHLDVAAKSVPLSDSIVVDLVGPDTIHTVLSEGEKTLEQRLDPGDWNFYAKHYANGMLVQQGEASATLAAGEEVSLSIAMHAVAGFFYVRIPLGLENSMGISAGTLQVRGQDFSKDYAFQMTESEATATTEMLVLGKEYEAKILLFSAEGDTLFEIDSQVTIDGENFVLDWQLNSLHANVSLSISSDSIRTLTAVAHLPAKLRAPKKGDLLITEFMTEGKEEFVEVYNASLDTLNLEGCSLWATSSSSLKQMTDSVFTAKVAPSAYLVFGKDSVDGRDVTVPLAMPGTKGSIVFRCASETVDSLFYASAKNVASDSLAVVEFPIDSKMSVQLPLSNYKTRAEGSSWCNGEFSLHAPAACAE